MSLLIDMICFQIQNMKFKDKRLKIMNEILNGIKVSTPYYDSSTSDNYC